MQPVYITLSSSGSSPWKLTNWHCTGPMNIGVSIACNSTSTWTLDYTVDDPIGTYPNPTLGTSAITIYSTTSGSSSTYATLSTPVAALRITMTAQSTASGKVTATILQSGIG